MRRCPRNHRHLCSNSLILPCIIITEVTLLENFVLPSLCNKGSFKGNIRCKPKHSFYLHGDLLSFTRLELFGNSFKADSFLALSNSSLDNAHLLFTHSLSFVAICTHRAPVFMSAQLFLSILQRSHSN